MRGLAPLAAGVMILFAQPPEEVRVSAHTYNPPRLHLTAQAQLVQLNVVVRDARGHAVAGLQHGDFEILDDGKPREIAAFSVETRPRAKVAAPPAEASHPDASQSAAARPAPIPQRSVLLFFDDLHANTGDLRRAQNAAASFVTNLDPGMRAGIFTASAGLMLDFTADSAALATAIEKLRSHIRVPESGLMPCPRISPYQAYLIFNNIDPSAMVAAVSEAAKCTGADSSVRNVYANGAARAGALSKLPRDNYSIMVQQQATQTWEMVRAASLDTYDALAAAVARLARLPGERVLLIVSEGFLFGPEEAARQQSLIDGALRAGVVINALDAKGVWAEAPTRPHGEISETTEIPTQTFLFEVASVGARISTLNATVSELSTATGGLFFHNSNDLAGGFEMLGGIPETSYLMAFRPDPQDAPGKYHKLKVRLTAAKQDYLETRPGYFVPSAPPAAPEVTERPLDREVLSASQLSEFPVQLAGRMGKTAGGEPQLSVIVHVDLSKLPFSAADGRHRQKLQFIAALMNGQGEMVAAKEGAMDLALKDETLTRLTASGINATLDLSAPPGAYRVRVVVEEAGGKMAALSQTVQLPE